MRRESRQSQTGGERGGSGLNLVIAVVIIGLGLHAIFQYGTVAYTAADMKKEMRSTVVAIQAAPGRREAPAQDALKRIGLAVKKLELPEETYINAQMVGNELTLEVAYEVEVPLLPFGMYKYKYVFSETATPAGFLVKDDTPAVK